MPASENKGHGKDYEIVVALQLSHAALVPMRVTPLHPAPVVCQQATLS
jgi:hypothetical protein